MTSPLSTTSYAALGLLAMRPMTPYELTQQMQRSLDYCWPASERSLYEQPERLKAAGLVAVTEAAADGPRRYAATEAGREAIRAWLATDTAMPKFQNQPLLRALLADQGTVADLHRVLDSLRAHVAARRRSGLAQLETYLTGDGLFQERAHIVTLVADLIARLLDVIDDWAGDVESLTAEWTTTLDLGLTPELRVVLERLVASQRARVERAAAD
jgi:DNA-binding PadR family transcriptional regulator